VVFVQLESVTGTHCVGAAAINHCGTTACGLAGTTACGPADTTACGVSVTTACAVASAGGTRTTAPARGPRNGSRGSDAEA
jgi:hypothetical protein